VGHLAVAVEGVVVVAAAVVGAVEVVAVEAG